MRICVVIPGFGDGGAQIQCIRLLNALQEIDGLDLHLVRFRKGEVHDAALQTRRLRIHDLVPRSHFDPRLLFDAARTVRAIRPDIILTWQIVCDVFGPFLRMASGNAAWVMTERDSAYPNGVRFRLRMLLGRFADAIVANSDAGIALWEGRNDMVIRADNIVASQIHETRPREKLVLAVGRLEAQKNILSTLAGFCALASKRPDLAFAIVGQGSLGETIDDVIATQGLGHCIVRPGFVKNPASWLGRAAALVTMSRHEGTANVLLEAVQAGIPILASDIAPHREILGEDYKFFLPLDATPETIADAIETLLELADPVRDFACARNRLAAMTPDRVAQRYLDIFRMALPQPALMIGPFPPPVHGAGLVTEATANLVAASGIRARRLSTSPGTLHRGLTYHIRRLRACLIALVAILTASRATKTYLVLSGGWGLAYDLILTVAARLRGFEIVFHHHSFAYLDRRSPLMATIIALAGHHQHHIVLCSAMARKLSERYANCGAVTVVSNAIHLPAASPSPRAGPLRTIGFLANLTRDKGIDTFIDLAALLRARGLATKAVIAGPAAEAGITDLLQNAQERLGGIEWLGPVHGKARESFFAQIDLLVLPSRYANEAQPLVIIEAQDRAIPVAASQRGSIATMLLDDPGLRLDPLASNLSSLVETIIALSSDSEAMADLRRRTLVLARDRRRCGNAQREQLVALLAPTTAPATNPLPRDGRRLPLP